MLPPALVAVVLQTVELPNDTEIDLFFGVGSSAVGAFLSTLIVGAIMVALAPGYVERVMRRVRDDPLSSFVYGLLWVILVAVLVVALVISILGILLVPILFVVVSLVWSIGAAIAFLAIADRLVDRSDGWLKPLLVAAALAGGLTLTGIGGIVSFAVGAAGFGAILADRYG
jgi:uncharacterized protein YacL